MKYQVNIGLEVHVELSTESKFFCGCSTKFGAPPNSQTCSICLGLPGVLPVINKKAVEYTLSAALALDCEVSRVCRFARKNYYYPDLPKNYQISQYDEPLAREGYLEFEINGKLRRVDIERVHLEEDAGKLIHGEDTQNPEDREASFIDYNRVGIPLMEIVSQPELNSPEEAYQYLVSLKRILRYLAVSDCNMEEGSLRCDANISVSPTREKLGTKTELKNMNSFKDLRDGLELEIKRQSSLLDRGEKVIQETRLWDPKKKRTKGMRSKEEAHDYRYFPEPDLLPIEVNEEWKENLATELPELPLKRYQRFIKNYRLPPYDAGVLTDTKELADYFEKCVVGFPHPKLVSNWIMGEFLRLVKKANLPIPQVKVSSEQIGNLLAQMKEGTLSGGLAKLVFEEMFKTGKAPERIIEEKKLVQITDELKLTTIVEEVVKENQEAMDDLKKGKKKALSFLVGQAMKKTKGKASPQVVNRLLKERVGSL